MASRFPSATNGNANGAVHPTTTTPRNRSKPDLLPTPSDQPEMSPTSKEFKESFATRRPSSQHLSPLRMKPTPAGVDAIDGVESRQEVEEEGVELFNHFIEIEMERTGIRETPVIEKAVESATIESQQEQPAVNVSSFKFEAEGLSMGSGPSGDTPRTRGDFTPSLRKYKHPSWAKSGQDLRALADTFAKSKERQGVRQKAEETVGKGDITAAMFWDMLSELFFQGQVTRERIVVLFFFCSDVAILALQKNTVEYFHRFLVWALQFIRTKVCSWVASNGGWEAVLYHSTSYLPVVGTVILAGGVVYLLYKMCKNANGSIVHR